MNRRQLLCAGLATGGLALLAACAPLGPSAPPSQTAAPGAAPQPTTGTGAASATGGTLRTAMPYQLNTLDGHVLNQATIDSTWYIFDRLTEYNDQLQPQPMLAESWDLSSDATRITFHLRKGVKFHTGRELTSDDVKASILRVRDPAVTAAQLAPQSAVWKTIDTPDPYTITLMADAPQPALFDFFEYLNIVDPVTAQGPDAATKAVGTGPFMFADWSPGERLTLKRNPSYWQTGLPKLDGVVVTLAGDVKTMITMLEGKAVDVALGPSLVDVARLRSDPAWQVLASPTPGTFQEFIVNTKLPGLDNPLVRQALNYAMDRQRMVDSVRRGVGQAQDLPWAPSSPAYDAAKNSIYAFDLDKARAALQQSGVTNLAVDVVFSTGGDGPAFAQIYQGDLTKIGVTANLKPMEGAAAGQARNEGRFGLYFTPHPFASLQPQSMITSPFFDARKNYSQFTDGTYTQLTAALLVETDPSKQKALYDQLNDQLLASSFALVISPAPPIVIAHAGVRGLRYDLHEALVMREVSIA